MDRHNFCWRSTRISAAVLGVLYLIYFSTTPQTHNSGAPGELAAACAVSAGQTPCTVGAREPARPQPEPSFFQCGLAGGPGYCPPSPSPLLCRRINRVPLVRARLSCAGVAHSLAAPSNNRRGRGGLEYPSLYPSVARSGRRRGRVHCVF